MHQPRLAKVRCQQRPRTGAAGQEQTVAAGRFVMPCLIEVAAEAAANCPQAWPHKGMHP